MGDIIACEPVAREVRRRHPDGYLIWFVREPYVDLVCYHPDLNHYLIEKCPSERVYLLKTGVFDRVYNLHISHRKCRYCPEDPVNPTADRIGLTFANYYDRGDLLYVFSQAAGLPAHMANAVGTDGLILLGKLFDFVDYRPYSGRYKRGEGVTILNHLGHPCAELPYQWVEEAARQRLGQPKLV